MNVDTNYTYALKGVAVGDTLWLPVEAFTRKQILNLLNQDYLWAHNWLIEKYYPIGMHPMYHQSIDRQKYPWLNSWLTWVCSDDTLLTFAISQSLKEKWWINIEDIIARHITYVTNEPFWFWTGTRTTITEIAQTWDYKNISSSNSFWNGFMMKQLPLAYYASETKINIEKELLALVKITHGHPISIIAAKVHHKLLVDLLLSKKKQDFDFYAWLQENVNYVSYLETMENVNPSISQIFLNIIQERNIDMSLEDIGKKHTYPIDNQIKNKKFNILSTLAIVYAIFARRKDFLAIQQWASIWWDTDSYASILWWMVALTQNDSDKIDTYFWNIHPRYSSIFYNIIGK